MKKLILLAIVIAVAVFVSPKAPQQNSADINRVQTDAKVTYPYDQLIARAWFVEMVLPTKG